MYGDQKIISHNNCNTFFKKHQASWRLLALESSKKNLLHVAIATIELTVCTRAGDQLKGIQL